MKVVRDGAAGRFVETVTDQRGKGRAGFRVVYWTCG
jgi:hypothetical protein